MVVVGMIGNYCFDYDVEGGYLLGIIFEFSGICIDILGNILVCDNNDYLDDSVYMLDKDGRFFCFFLCFLFFSLERRIWVLGVDDSCNLWIGDVDINEIRVYKYLEWIDVVLIMVISRK